jgi:flagellar biosynthetic protein FliQ
MSPQDAVDLGRNAVLLTLMLAAPGLAVGMIVGLIIGLLQALTQVQEQTVSFVPKLVAMFLVMLLTLPWMITQMTNYFQDLISEIPGNL